MTFGKKFKAGLIFTARPCIEWRGKQSPQLSAHDFGNGYAMPVSFAKTRFTLLRVVYFVAMLRTRMYRSDMFHSNQRRHTRYTH